MCGEEITEPAQDIRGTFENKQGLLVQITVKSPSHYADICKPCVIKIIQEGTVINWMERRYEHEEKVS